MVPAANSLASNWIFDVVDFVGDTGACPAMELDATGRPHIVYWNRDTSTIFHAVKDAGSWALDSVVSTPSPPPEYCPLAMTLDASGSPVIAYTDGSFLWYAFKTGGVWRTELADAGYFVVGGVMLNTTGLPSIGYIDFTDPLIYHVKFAYRTLTGWRNETVESTNKIGGLTAKTGPDGNAHMVYVDLSRRSLKYVHRLGGIWNMTEWIQNSVSRPDLAFDSLGRPWLGYSVSGIPDRLMIGRPSNGTWDAVDTGLQGGCPRLQFDARDWPRVAYMLQDSLFFARWQGSLWSWEHLRGPSVGHCAFSFSLRNEVPHIAHYWATTQDLEYATVGTDNRPPDSQALPLRPYWTNGTRWIDASAFDAQGYVANVSLMYRFSPDNASWGAWNTFGTSVAPPWRWLFPFTAGPGYYEFYTVSWDTSGNAEPPPPAADATTGFDPITPISNVLPLAPYWHDQPSAIVSANASDALSGVAQVTLLFQSSTDNVTWGTWVPYGTRLAAPWDWSFSFPAGEGYYRFHSLAEDFANNFEPTKNTAESVVGYRRPPDYLTAAPRPAITATVGVSQLVPLSIQVQNRGGASGLPSALVYFNASTPSTPFSSSSIPPIDAGGITGPFPVVWPSPSTPGLYLVSVFVDRYNDVTESNETNNQFNWTIRVVTGPLTSLAVGQPNYTAGATYVTAATPLGLSPLDQSGTGIRRTMYRVDGGIWVNYSMTGSLELNSEGEHFVEWFSEDFAGNIEPTLNATFRVDDSPPVTTLVVGNPKYLEADIFVTPLTPLSLSALDRGLLPVGLGSTEYRIDGGAWTTYGGPLLLSMEGRNTLELSSSDRLGNAESPHETVVIVDDTAPAISIDVGTPRYEGADTYVTAATRFTLTAVDGGPVPVGVADLEYRVGGAWIPYGVWLVIAEPDGARTLGYRATDFLGHVTTRQLAVVIDGTPPVTTPIPSEGTYTPGTALAFAAADAGSGVARTDVTVDGGPWTPYTAPLVLAEGLHTIGFRSVDYLENMEAERTLSVTITRAPSVPPSTNWKPLIAAFFAAVLSLAGAWSAQRTPWPSGSRRRLRAFALAAFPFVLGEAATGVLSSLTGLLSIPPMLGVGTAVDIGILLASLGVSLYRVRRRTQIA